MAKAGDKPLVWLQSEIKTPPFSKDARIEAGVLLRRLQRGDLLSLPHSRPMPSLGNHCHDAKRAYGDTTIWQSETLMDKRKAKRLLAAGWKAGSTKEFLGLSDEESAIIELKLELAGVVKEHRCRRAMTQQQLGKLIGSSQSRIAKMEAGDASVSIDLMVRSLLRMGASRKDLAARIATPSRRRAA